jgi:hypothetical protein
VDGSETRQVHGERPNHPGARQLLTSARAIKGDNVAAADIVARLQTLRHLLKQVGHDV